MLVELSYSLEAAVLGAENPVVRKSCRMRTSYAALWKSVAEYTELLQIFLEAVDIPCANGLPLHSCRSVKPACVQQFLEFFEVVHQSVLGSRKDEEHVSHLYYRMKHHRVDFSCSHDWQEKKVDTARDRQRVECCGPLSKMLKLVDDSPIAAYKLRVLHQEATFADLRESAAQEPQSSTWFEMRHRLLANCSAFLR